jgi:hypothetical protein
LLVANGVRPGIGVDPDMAVAHLHRERRHIIGPLVKRAAAFQVKTGMMPVTGQDAVLDRAPIQGEAHVGTAIVYGIDFVLVVKEGHRVPVDMHGEIAFFLQLVQRGHACPCSFSHLGSSLFDSSIVLCQLFDPRKRLGRCLFKQIPVFAGDIVLKRQGSHAVVFL